FRRRFRRQVGAFLQLGRRLSIGILRLMSHDTSACMIRAVVFADQPGERYRAGRTVRALARWRTPVEEVVGSSPATLAQALDRAPCPVWLIRAGCWPTAPGIIEFPPPSATGRSLCAFGKVRTRPSSSGCHAQEWTALLAETGGDFSLLADLHNRLPL